MPYRTMLLDPPWNERGGGRIKRGADKHYDVASTKDILSFIMQSGMWEPDTRRCSVWMWSTANFLNEALWLMERLGAKYITNVVWVKAKSYTVCPSCDADRWDELHCQECKTGGDEVGWKHVVYPQAPGLGQRLRLCHKHLLYGRIGRVPVPSTSNRVPSVIYAPRARHSQKPVEAYELIEKHDGAGRRLEWFARARRETWEAWGNEV